jgi:hypothetical protein
MKKALALFTTCILLSCSLSAQIGRQFDNPGFEEWTTRETKSVVEPVHWHSGGTATGTFAGFLSNQVESSTQTRPGSTGSKSVRIFPTSILGITANGNLTNGRMNASSMSATGSGNYNYTQRSESAYNTPIYAIPDSLVIWVCFRSESSSQKAQLHAAVHGDADYKFVADGTEEPANMLVASARHTFTRTSTANGAYNWTRLSVPFVKDGPCNDPRYILFTITTNETPGAGSSNDDLFVDDIELIYNPDQIKENEDLCELSPNPFFKRLDIHMSEIIQNIYIYDMLGHRVRSMSPKTNQLSLDLSDLPSGSYLIQIDFGQHIVTKRIVKI